MPRKAKSTKPVACEACQGTDLIRRITTYPVRLTGPLEGKQIHVGARRATPMPVMRPPDADPGGAGQGGP